MGEVVQGTMKTTLDIPVENVLKGADEAGLDIVIVIGRDADGELYVGSSIGSTGDILYWIEKAKQLLLE